MKRILHPTAPIARDLHGGIAAIGNFDGVHRGHQAVVERTIARARAIGCPALVVTFDPHPSRVFDPARPPFLLTSLDQKLDLLERCGVDAAVVLRFDRTLAALSGETFVRNLLVGMLGLVGSTTGQNFAFGKDRAGSAETFRHLHDLADFTHEEVASVRDIRSVPVSSTRIRADLEQGYCRQAAAMIGRPFTLRGEAGSNQGPGGGALLPTIGLAIDSGYVRPPQGLYRIRCSANSGAALTALAQLHSDPTDDRGLRLTIRHRDVPRFYGASLDIELLSHLGPG